MNRKDLIEHFRELAAWAEKPLIIETKRNSGLRIVYEGRRACLPARNKKMPRMAHVEQRLGLHAGYLARRFEQAVPV